MTDIETVLRRHARWLEKRLREYERARRQLLADDGTPRTLYRGQWIFIHLASQTNTCRLERGTLQVPIQGDPRSLLRDWYRSQARKELGAMSSLLAAEMGVRYQRLQIRLQRTRWGSYSVRGTLSLNWRLLMAPPEVSRYVVVHELAHARHMNHSSSFWRTVQRFCPEYRQHIDWLRENRLLLEALSSFSHLTSGSRKDSAPR
jgi:predicted metal-dependent hydrolase